MQILKIQILFSIISLFFNFNAYAQTSLNQNQQKICPNDLNYHIEKIIKSPNRERETWGILIETLDSHQILAEFNSNKYLIPASNVKLLTTAASLLKLGADYQIKTPVYIEGNPPHLTSLRIVGKGDPTLTTQHLEYLGKQLKNIGVTQIEQIIVEDGYLPEPYINPSWEFSDLYYYYASPVNSLILNQNTFVLSLLPQEVNQPVKIDFFDAIAAKQLLIKNKTVTGLPNVDYNINLKILFEKSTLEFSGELAENAEPDIWNLAIVKPGEYFLESLYHALNIHGISIKNRLLLPTTTYHKTQENVNNSSPIINQDNRSGTEELFLVFKSPQLIDLITAINQESNNLFSEVLLKKLALNSKDNNGIQELKKILTELGVNANNYHLQDGSGLSRHNLASNEAFVETLKLISNTKYGKIYRNSLTVAGKNGTLKRRFTDTIVKDNLQGKTGTLTGVSALSGYLEIPNYEPVVFSIIVNNSKEKASISRQIIDEIVLLISQINKCDHDEKVLN
jgi:D-alanyl-D-alanine carboxypeptidase/D-alanyl-D-alanine-endopeptidase (penicillin-binding protein 4)